MTPQDQNQSFDQKKGSADDGVLGQRQGLPGHNIADGESADLDAQQRGLGQVEEDAAPAGPRGASAEGDRIPEQPGCGPNVTDYPGIPDDGAPTG
jgi:hypothetical protein